MKKNLKKVTNTPKELGDEIANAGFKVVLHASNYAYCHKEKELIILLVFGNQNIQILQLWEYRLF